ncbi:MAG: ferredoxin family 2Fe-2S iron-sulfur cluster binding protein [Alphaproteobacteria bacterium]|nr:ferredoxin family 2Fe-2S iron-sulfur cluster binding protein [Alphaproteobacteria bacterium]
MPKMTFVHPDGSEQEVEAPNGISVLEVARIFDVPLEGACEGSLACSTCHIIVDSDHFDTLEEASEDEEDMLDLAFGLTETSRLGCQIMLSDALDGLRVKLPSATRNVQTGG